MQGSLCAVAVLDQFFFRVVRAPVQKSPNLAPLLKDKSLIQKRGTSNNVYNFNYFDWVVNC